VLTKDLLRVSRAGGGYHLQYADESHADLAARVIGVYQGHVGERRGDLDAALQDLEGDSEDFKLVRGLAKLLDRGTTVETRAPLPPARARRAAFEAGEAVGVVTEPDRERALTRAAERLGVDPDDVDRSLYADLPEREVVTAVDAEYTPETLVEQYNLSLAQTALFDAVSVRIRSNDPRRVISAVKRLRLMYEVRRTDAGRVVEVTGPTTLFSNTRRYGTRFARLLRTVAGTAEWRLQATIDDDGSERELTITDVDVSVPGVEPVADVGFDSGVEADFAARFEALDLDWRLVREPEPLAAGAHVVVPDFAFEYAPGGRDSGRDGPLGVEAPFRIFFEIMGFWTPEYVRKKLDRLADLEDVEMLVAADESLGVGEDDPQRLTDTGDADAEVEARDHRAITYRGTVRVKDVRDALRVYEERFAAAESSALPDELVPDADAVTLEDIAGRHGVSVEAIEDKRFPKHKLLGRTLVRPSVLDELAGTIEAGMDYADAEAAVDEAGIDDASAVLSRLGYRVAWDGLSGGTVRERT